MHLMFMRLVKVFSWYSDDTLMTMTSVFVTHAHIVGPKLEVYFILA